MGLLIFCAEAQFQGTRTQIDFNDDDYYAGAGSLVVVSGNWTLYDQVDFAGNTQPVSITGGPGGNGFYAYLPFVVHSLQEN